VLSVTYSPRLARSSIPFCHLSGLRRDVCLYAFISLITVGRYQDFLPVRLNPEEGACAAMATMSFFRRPETAVAIF
jgi:hypothetical protein